jgi:hypothetical protein
MAGHHPHQEHRAHLHAKARVAHITKGYATGGAVSHGDDVEDEAERKEHKRTMRKRGGKIEGKAAHERLDRGRIKRADGGKVGKKKGATTVNVIVSGGQHPGAGGPMPPPGPGIGAAAPPPPPPPRPPMAPPGGPGMPPPGMGGMPPGGPPGMPPGMVRARGGRVGKAGSAKGSELDVKGAKAIPKRARGGNVDGEELRTAMSTGRANSSTSAGRPKDGPAWKEGLRNGTQLSHRPGNTDGETMLAHDGVKKVRTYRKGGGVKDVSVDEKPPIHGAVEAGFGSAHRNPFPHMTAGSKSGVGRLQKLGKSRGASEAA